MEFYQHSGCCGRWGVPIASITGVVTGLVLGLAYAYGINWIPFIYLNFLFTLAFGAAVGAAVAWGAKLGKIRNVPVAVMLAATVGVLAVYFAWVFDPMARVDIVTRPIWSLETLWEYMKLGYAQGFWGIGEHGDPVTGPFLAGVWILEAAMIIGLAVVTVRAMLGDVPFCEETNQWTTLTKGAARVSLIGDEKVDEKVHRLLQGDLDSLSEFYRAVGEEPAVLRLDLATCPDCPTCNYLSVTMERAVVNKKGEVSKQEDRLLVNLRVDPEDVAKIQSAGIERPVEEPVGEPESESTGGETTS